MADIISFFAGSGLRGGILLLAVHLPAGCRFNVTSRPGHPRHDCSSGAVCAAPVLSAADSEKTGEFEASAAATVAAVPAAAAVFADTADAPEASAPEIAGLAAGNGQDGSGADMTEFRKDMEKFRTEATSGKTDSDDRIVGGVETADGVDQPAAESGQVAAAAGQTGAESCRAFGIVSGAVKVLAGGGHGAFSVTAGAAKIVTGAGRAATSVVSGVAESAGEHRGDDVRRRSRSGGGDNGILNRAAA